jgi:gamma-glutamylcyclotransferase (GGCT)/AIG2-like uncharacterized protein YtfP
MSFFKSLKTFGHITEAITHYNEALDKNDHTASMTEISLILSNALNKIQTEWVLYNNNNNKEIGEIKAFQSLFLEGLCSEEQMEFLKSKGLRDLVLFEPQIMNHDTLRHHRYRPDVDIEPSLKKKATAEHQKLVTAYEAFTTQPNDEITQRVLKRTAELLYIVRSNIAHGEKTPYGPDIRKKERDEEVCGKIVPLQLTLLKLLFDKPDNKLIVYGTLAPGMPNHYMIADLKGNWKKCSVNAAIKEIDGLQVLSWDISKPEIGAQLFISTFLPSRWGILDQYEGSLYKRRLAPASTEEGALIANVYLNAR